MVLLPGPDTKEASESVSELNHIAKSEEKHAFSGLWVLFSSSTTKVDACSAKFLPWHVQLSPAKVETDSIGLDSALWETIPRGLEKLS